MAIGWYDMIKLCADCAHNLVQIHKNAIQMVVFRARAPLEFLAIDTLDRGFTTRRGNKF